jgi:hypothetical protein
MYMNFKRLTEVNVNEYTSARAWELTLYRFLVGLDRKYAFFEKYDKKCKGPTSFMNCITHTLSKDLQQRLIVKQSTKQYSNKGCPTSRRKGP